MFFDLMKQFEAQGMQESTIRNFVHGVWLFRIFCSAIVTPQDIGLLQVRCVGGWEVCGCVFVCGCVRGVLGVFVCVCVCVCVCAYLCLAHMCSQWYTNLTHFYGFILFTIIQGLPDLLFRKQLVQLAQLVKTAFDEKSEFDTRFLKATVSQIDDHFV